ncbi:glycosyltransferase [Nostoc sp. 3335mG]|nr:glycosyltransferase [Nostoc sp. 3335mG]
MRGYREYAPVPMRWIAEHHLVATTHIRLRLDRETTIAPCTRKIGDVDVRISTRDAAVQEVAAAIGARVPGAWGFCNAHTVNVARKRPDFRAALARMTLFNDGAGLDLASRLLYGEPFPENLNGTDFTPLLLLSLPAKTTIFLVGSAPGVAEMAAVAIRATYPNIAIVGMQHGFFAAADEDAIFARIAASRARLVLVAMGHPVQELWAARASPRLGMPLLCVGAFLDFAAGKVSRAPRTIRRLRLEWAYRLAQEPRRLARRYLAGNALFVGAMLRQRLQHRSARP